MLDVLFNYYAQNKKAGPRAPKSKSEFLEQVGEKMREVK